MDSVGRRVVRCLVDPMLIRRMKLEYGRFHIIAADAAMAMRMAIWKNMICLLAFAW
jgi:hypothetical protein